MLTLTDDHKYFWAAARVPGVSEITSLMFSRWQVDQFYLDKGRINHLISQYHDEGVLAEDSVDPALVGYFDSYKRWRAEFRFEPIGFEQIFYHGKYKFAGRPDMWGKLGSIRNSCLAVIDKKFAQPWEGDPYQASSYLFLLRANGIPIEKTFDVYFSADGKYKMIEVKQPTAKFMKFVSYIPKWREINGIMCW